MRGSASARRPGRSIPCCSSPCARSRCARPGNWRCSGECCRERPMIPRYSRPEMVALWTPERRYQTWLQVELAAGRAKAREAVVKRAVEHKRTPCIGRSHGIHAEPTTFGWKLIVWADELARGKARLERAREIIAVGKLSGAVGTFAHLSPAIEEKAMAALGLRAAPASTQIVQRDRHAEYFTALALAGASIEKFAVEIRHLQRTEVREAEEAFGRGQKGSSAMPHKRNPVLSENLSGLARLLRGYALSALEDVPLWHERDISHSSVERVIGPDATVTLDFMLHRFAGLMEGLRVFPERMRENLELTRGLIFSQPVLLALVGKGMERQAAYAVVQRNAMKVWDEDRDFRSLLAEDPEVKKLLKPAELAACFDLERALRHVDGVFERVLGKRSEEHTSELQSLAYLVCRLLLEKKKKRQA